MKAAIILTLGTLAACAQTPQKLVSGQRGSESPEQSSHEPGSKLDQQGVGQGNGIIFNIDNALAVGLLGNSSISSGIVATQPNLLAVNSDGTTAVASNGKFSAVYQLATGILAHAIVDDRTAGQDFEVWYWARKGASTAVKIITALDSRFVGETPSGDFLFTDTSLFRHATHTLEKLKSNLREPEVIKLSGGFVLLQTLDGLSSPSYQVYDLSTSKRYNLSSCNGPKIAALSATHVYINDCSPNSLLDMQTGLRTEIDQLNYSSEFLANNTTGGVFLTGVCGALWAPDQQSFLCHVTDDGNLSLVSDLPLVAAAPAFGIEANRVLFGNEDWFVVRELTRITAVRRLDGAGVPILSGYNVFSVNMLGSKVYFTGESTLGEPIAGVKDLADESVVREIKVPKKLQALVPIN